MNYRYIGSAICWLLKHKMRKPRKGEPSGVKICHRCGVKVPVKTRKRT